jgi:hypothetical protein
MSTTTPIDIVLPLILSDDELRAVTSIAARLTPAQRARLFEVLIHSGARERDLDLPAS